MLGLKRHDIQFERFFWEYKGMIASVAYKYTHNRALTDDLIQDVFLKIYMNFSKVMKLESPDAYIYRIAVNTINDYFRSNKNRIQEIAIPEYLRDAVMGEEGNREEEFEKERMYEMLTLLIIKMAKKRSAVMTLRLIEERSFREIGESLKMSDVSARNHYAQGIKELRKLVKEKVL